jgi:hypothetical protein
VLIFGDNEDYTEKENLHLVKHTMKRSSFISDKELSKIKDVLELALAVTEGMSGMLSIMKEDFHILKELKGQDYDCVLYDAILSDVLLATYLEKPSMMQMFYQPSLYHYYFFGSPSVMNSQYQTFGTVNMIADDGYLNHALMKISENVLSFVMDFYLRDAIIPPDTIHPELKATWDLKTLSKGYTFGFGRDDFRDRTQNSGNQAMFYPAVPTKSKFSDKFLSKSLAEEYTTFIDRYESVIYISFGTMFMPNHE